MNGCRACLEKERIGLLEFKAFLISNCELIDNLDSWVEDGMSDCCGWDRVKCNTTSRRVIDLSLGDVGDYCSLNLSMLHPFEELLSLNLSGNGFYSWIDQAAIIFLRANSRSTYLLTIPSLKWLDLQVTNNKFEVAIKYPGWIPSFQLKVLVLQNCALESIPEFLFHQFKLKVIDLSNNKIEGNFPIWLLENNTELDLLSLKNNCFKGQFHLPTYTSFNITMLDISGNQFIGQLQELGGQIFPNTEFLNLSNNGFQGDFLFSPGDDCKLNSLDLSFNNFSGAVPDKLLSSCTSLEFLRLSNNNFHGQIFTSRFNLPGLYLLQLNDNQFVGTLSSSVVKMPNLWVLDLSNNRFHGEIPRWINNITLLIQIDLSQNAFTGQISCEIWSALFVDLSHNSLSGSLPSCFIVRDSWDSLHMNLQGNRLTGSIPENFVNSSNLLTLNLRDNELSGSIPNKFCRFPNLRVLLLGGNRLNGSIPNRLCQLNNITLLDVSRNSFSGFIPNCLYNLSFGRKGLHDDFNEVYGGTYDFEITEKVGLVTKHVEYRYKGDVLNYLFGLDLSHNNLEGQIPYELGKLSQLSALNFSHNCLTGSIPASLSNLTQLESFDLSHNKLSGEIPSQLIALHFLEVFSVAYNNLSGKILDMGQFSTFDNSSYEGNPFLCGPLLEKNCTNDNESPQSPTRLAHKADGKWHEIDEVRYYIWTPVKGLGEMSLGLFEILIQ
ncbi:hypothetical protein GH714_023495 [Hevea brasiliensis]|uniref:Leucine-rich repeat-containing N-terminal plant-type domain-containing protein n=1 Tax=Hevea brasiliensis TaxID=3981 RepID=A0A6A6LIY2_HEVBR|nr:hypothetical protein GH714_023495 [Hevea brasiliensis]